MSKSTLLSIKKAAYAFVAMAMVATVSFFVFPVSQASAAQVSSRSIELSDSTPSATNVTYNVTFTPGTSITHPDIIIDFCSNSPIIGDSCTATAGTDVPDFSSAAASGWTVSTIGSGRGVKLTTSTVSLTASTPATITITGVINPSNTATFYGRLLTYTTGGAGTNTSVSPGSYTDYGGVALSTATAISITARVMEQLTFCTSAISLSATDCTSATTPSLTLGHTVGSATVLTSSAVDTANAYTQLSTNAVNGAIVRMKDTSSTACGGLSRDSGTTCGIPAVASGATTPQTITAGTAAFGMCVTAGSANTTATVPYNSASCTQYGMDDSSATKVTSTYGSPIFSSSGPVNQENDTLKFAATASLTTPAGVYTANDALIATGTF